MKLSANYLPVLGPSITQSFARIKGKKIAKNWAARINYLEQDVVVVPRIRKTFEEIATFVSFVRFCRYMDNTNNTVVVGRKDKEEAWFQLVLGRYEAMKDEDVAALVGKTLGGLNVLRTEEEVREKLKKLFCEKLEEVFGWAALVCWEEKEQVYPGIGAAFAVKRRDESRDIHEEEDDE
ncbi:hypothetical protein G7Y89_g2748 [Cudoniella acicularis]|uniref:Uncharacterized protein n=1 Tax=Cudoniella acicularis TaxID=354080 RepID=A0A8H4RSU3_9HELO|nr:hypothetical protein G7Y89_g2748 [Cudoniella acicularis]